MTSSVARQFHEQYSALPTDIQKQAREKFSLWLENSNHPSLHFKKVSPNEPVWSVRINRSYRALGLREEGHVEWFWIGNHDEYERMLSRLS